MALKYVPPIYMWIATFEDGQALPQFDPETGKQNKFPFHDQSRITKIGWFPIMPHMVVKILQGEGIITRAEDRPIYELDLKQGQKPFLRYTTVTPSGKYKECLECGTRWIFNVGRLDPHVKRQGYSLASNHKIYCVTCASHGFNVELKKDYQTWICPEVERHPNRPKITRFIAAICPGCGYHRLPTDGPDEIRIQQKATDMRYLIYSLGVVDEKIIAINEWGEVINKR